MKLSNASTRKQVAIRPCHWRLLQAVRHCRAPSRTQWRKGGSPHLATEGSTNKKKSADWLHFVESRHSPFATHQVSLVNGGVFLVQEVSDIIPHVTDFTLHIINLSCWGAKVEETDPKLSYYIPLRIQPLAAIPAATLMTIRPAIFCIYHRQPYLNVSSKYWDPINCWTVPYLEWGERGHTSVFLNPHECILFS